MQSYLIKCHFCWKEHTLLAGQLILPVPCSLLAPFMFGYKGHFMAHATPTQPKESEYLNK